MTTQRLEWTPQESIAWAAARLAAYLDFELEACDLTARQYRMLVAIAHGPLSATGLAEWIGVSPPSATLMVRGLIQRGAVSRTVASEDQRRVWLSLTPRGSDLLVEVESIVRKKLEQVASEFDDPKEGLAMVEGLTSWNLPLDRFRAKWHNRPNSSEPEA